MIMHGVYDNINYVSHAVFWFDLTLPATGKQHEANMSVARRTKCVVQGTRNFNSQFSSEDIGHK